MRPNLTAKLEEITEIKDRLLNLPDKIRESKQRTQRIRQNLRNLTNELEFLDINLRNAVYQTFQGTKSNKEERERKFTQTARRDPEFTRVKRQIQSLEDRIRAQVLETEKLENTFSALKKIAGLLVAELHVLIPSEAYIKLKILEQRFNLSQERQYPTKLNL